MFKKIKIEVWELIYFALINVMIGIAVGCVFVKSSPSTPSEILIINMATIVVLMMVFYVIIKVLLYFSKKLDIIKEKE